VFYGANPKPLEAVANIIGPVLGIYAGEDDSINSGLPAIVENMIKYKKTSEMKWGTTCILQRDDASIQ
jgi:carboxymethylenebutenolidase